MSHEVLKELLIAVGFKTDESSYKRATTLIANVEKQLVANDKAAKEREASEKSRVANQTLRAAEVAANLRMVGVAVAGFATLAAGAMVAVANAIKNGIGEFDRLAYISSRTGASVNNIKAIGYAFSQTGSSAEAAVQALESFAKARRANPGVDAMIRSYGVSTQGDSSEVLANSLDAITKRHPQYTSQQIAGLFGISPDEVDQPMGSVSSSNDNSRSATMNSNVNVTVNGASDPQATASAVTRGIGQANDMSLRNVQTAIR